MSSSKTLFPATTRGPLACWPLHCLLSVHCLHSCARFVGSDQVSFLIRKVKGGSSSFAFRRSTFNIFVLQGRENTDSSPGNWNKSPLPSVLDGLLMNILAGWNALLLAQTVEYQWQELLSQEIPTYPRDVWGEMMGNGYIHGIYNDNMMIIYDNMINTQEAKWLLYPYLPKTGYDSPRMGWSM